MGGEISFNVKRIVSTDQYRSICKWGRSNDLSMQAENGETLHIVGQNNDWGYLALQILEPINDEYNKLYHAICVKANKDGKPDAALLGDEQWRIVDIIEKLGGNKTERYEIYGVPLIHNKMVESGITYLKAEKTR